MVNLSRAQRLQIMTLVTLTTVVQLMLEEVELTVNAQRTRKRVERQVRGLLAGMPKYGERSLKRLVTATNRVWGVQGQRSVDAVTMLNLSLYLVEEVRAKLRDAGRRPLDYAPWTRLAGSIFTLLGHIGDQWIDPSDLHQVEAVELAETIKKAA